MNANAHESDLIILELACEDLRASRDALATHLGLLEQAIQRVKRDHLPTVRRHVAAAAAAEAAVRHAAESARDRFDPPAPRTRLYHGIKVGFEKGRGRLVIGDATTTCALIRKHHQDDWDRYIAVSEAPIRASLATLDAKSLAAIGVRLEGTEDRLVLRDAIGEVDRLIDSMLAALREDLDDEAGA